MEKYSLSAMRSHCEALSRDGRELNVRWEGGGDDGYFFLYIDEEELLPRKDIEEAILGRVMRSVGYGGFSGDFSTEGHLVYDKEEQAFVGYDNYWQTAREDLRCDISVCLPKDIWFDSLVVTIDSEWGEAVKVSISLNLSNGPVPPMFTAIQKDLEQQIRSEVLALCEDFNNMQGVDDLHRLSRNNFEQIGDMLCCKIKTISILLDVRENHEVCISLAGE